ncbi:D-alanyl-D-alanine dipeptidase [Izhakiella capsodis]|uniref:D-alanyl-D-alanine dipeptidase n=1 Tax=Izhakiella capsodis TaxID=1367852 RepID=A0A1I4W6G1_9GAMM|nr:D-alanyl-D-alanine dipeptidase [Izhakiella capsodis]
MPLQTQLADTSQRVSDARINLKYASDDNITGKPIYRHPRAMLHADAVEKRFRDA